MNGFFPDTDSFHYGLVVLAIGCSSLLLGGCVQTRITEPKRAAVEQLLLSTATDRALVNADFSLYQGKKVFVDATYLDSYDKEYVIGSLRDALSSDGALLVETKEASEAIVELRSGALSADGSDSLIGLPKFPVPVPFAGTMETPEIALFKAQRQYGTAKLAILGYWTKSRMHAQSTGPLVGTSYMKYYTVLGYIKYTSTDIPEKLRKKETEGH